MKTTKGLEKKEIIEIKEKFMSVDTRPLDSKHRITLGGRLQRLMMSKMKIDSYQVFVGKDGDILLRPAVTIPSNEVWVYQNPKVIGRIRKGLNEAASGQAEKVEDLDDFLNNL
ncbi:MAG: hypothetical protein WBE75_07375 [Candidatus Omnitrophota bacterium]|jgi:hypothetical protein